MVKPDKKPRSEIQASKRVLVACENITLAKRYAALLGREFELVFSASGVQANKLLGNDQADILLVDTAFNNGDLAGFVRELADSRPGIRVVVIGSEDIPYSDQQSLLRAGVHGFCKRNTTSALLTKAIQLVSEGEFWLQRKLLTQLIGELAREVRANRQNKPPESSKALQALTPRELEVAEMVHLGNNNKTIARAMSISERTVKAHLSAIFRKLNIDNRLQLALFFNKMTS